MELQLQLRDGPAWRQAIERGDLGVWDLRPLQETVHHSPRWKERFGFPCVHEADSTDFWRCRVHPDDIEAMLEAMRNTRPVSSRSTTRPREWSSR